MLRNSVGTLVDRKVLILSCLAMCLLLSCAVYFGFKRWESNWYRGLIPAEVEVGDALLIDGESGFREGCGVAIFRLTPQMRERIKALGLVALDGPLDQRSHVHSPRASRAWAETPYVETGDGMTLEDTWQVGLSCADKKPELVRRITTALRQPGSFVKKLHEAAVVVVPASGIVALVYFG
jgi:hypothetical protein